MLFLTQATASSPTAALMNRVIMRIRRQTVSSIQPKTLGASLDPREVRLGRQSLESRLRLSSCPQEEPAGLLRPSLGSVAT